MQSEDMEEEKEEQEEEEDVQQGGGLSAPTFFLLCRGCALHRLLRESVGFLREEGYYLRHMPAAWSRKTEQLI